jgi:RNA polymerase I-specific transcription initiation factor RRN3
MQFARVAHATNFVYCYSIMKDNRRSEYNSSFNGRPSQEQKPSIQLSLFADSMHAELNTFFPFDPYRLPRSSSYIQGVYREWSAVAIDDGEEEEDEEEDEVQEGYIGFDIHRPDTRDDSSGLGESFGGMSISPAPNALTMSIS